MKKKQQTLISILSIVIILTFFAVPTLAQDSDGDSIDDSVDNCPTVCNSDQFDADNDTIGDVCDDIPGCGGCGEPACELSCDLDSDGILNTEDNCPEVANFGQENVDNDTLGDACDTDTVYGYVDGFFLGNAIEDVTVDIYRSNCGSAILESTVQTDSTGYYSFGNLPNGDYNVIPDNISYLFNPEIENVQVPQTVNQSYNFTAMQIQGFTDDAFVSNSTVLIKFLLTGEEDLTEFNFNWDGTNYSMYDESLIAMYNFDSNFHTEQLDAVIDVSKYGNNGLIIGNPSWTTSTLINPLTIKYAHQGYARTDDFHYTFHGNEIIKYDLGWNSVASNNKYLIGIVQNHLGDGDYYDGKIYVPVEEYIGSGGCGESTNESIFVINATDLTKIAEYDISAQGYEVSGLTVVPEDNIIYTVSYCDDSIISKYDLTDFSYLGNIQLSEPVVRKQGLTYDSTNELFYLSSNGLINAVVVADKSGNILGNIYEHSFNPPNFEGLEYFEDILYVLTDNGSQTSIYEIKRDGKYGGSLTLDGDGDAFWLSNAISGDAMTVSMWVYPNISGTENSMLGVYGDSETSKMSWGYVGGDRLGIGDDLEGWLYAGESGDYVSPQWYYLTFVWDGTNRQIWIDGVLIDQSPSIAVPNDYTGNQRIIGGDIWGSNSFEGSIDEVRIWNRGLSADEIAQHYMSNLQKHTSSSWSLYVNQLENPTTSLPDGEYTYYASSKNSLNEETASDVRTITVETE